MEQASKSSNFKKKVLDRVKQLTNEGRHLEASALFKKYFPDFGKWILTLFGEFLSSYPVDLRSQDIVLSIYWLWLIRSYRKMSKSPNKGKKGSANNKKQNQGNATAKKAKNGGKKKWNTWVWFCQ